MRKNLAKHTAKKLPLAKRVLALCFALIFVCSCLLPAFANGTGAGLDTPGTEVVEAADPGTEPEPMDLYDEPAAVADEPEAMDDDFGMADEPAAMDDQVEKPVVDDEPAAMDDQVEKPVVDDEPAAQDNEVEKPVEGGEPPVADDTPAAEGATKTTTDASGNIVYEYDTSGTTFPDDDAAALPDGDQVLDKLDAAFSIPTNIYHFWLKKMSSYDLADIADAAKTAEMTVEQYLAMYGTEKGCYHIMTAADGANLKDYQFADPTSNDDPEGNSRAFAGWYYTDELGDEQKFVFDEHLYVSEGTTVEVYAKWEELKDAVEEIQLGDNKVSIEVKNAPDLTVKELDSDTYSELGHKVLNRIGWDEFNVLYMFDIEPKDRDGLVVKSPEKVTISGLNIYSSADVKVFHMGNYFEEIPVEISSDGVLTFTPNGFSPFAIATVDNTVGNEDVVMYAFAELDDSATGYTETARPNVQTKITAKNKSNWRNPSYSWKVVSGNEVLEIVSQTNDSVTVQGKAIGEAIIEHKYWYWTPIKGSEERIEYYNVTVDKWKEENPVTDCKAGIYYLKDPKGDTISNNTNDWMPDANSTNLFATIHTTGDPTWTSGNGEDYKNIVTTDDQRVGDYIDGVGTTGLVLRTLENGTKVFVVPKTINNAKNDLFDQVWNSVKDISAYRSLLGDKDNVQEIILTPQKISRNNQGDNYNETYHQYHVDCTLTVVNKVRFTAKFYVSNPTTTDLWEQVDAADYVEGEAISITKRVTIGQSITDETTGIKYVLKGWYLEGPYGDGEPYREGELTEEDWSNTGTNGTVGYKTTAEDEVRADSEVRFYAVYEPDTTGAIEIGKTVKGLFGDKEKEFYFTVTDKNGNTQRFELQNGESTDGDAFKLAVQEDDRVTIAETNAAGYVTTAEIKDASGQIIYSGTFKGDKDAEERTLTITITKEMLNLGTIHIGVINQYDAPVDNGVLLDTLPYILILVVVVGGGVLLFLRKRKNDDDE